MASQGPRGKLRLGWIAGSIQMTVICGIAGIALLQAPSPSRAVEAMVGVRCYGGGTSNVDGGPSLGTPGFCEPVFGEVSNGGGNPGSSGDVGPSGGGTKHTSSNKAPTTDSNKRPSPKKSPCNKDQNKSADQVADPIILSSGAKVDTVTDFALPGEMGLKFERYYNSRFECSDSSCVGDGAWTTNLDYFLMPPSCAWDPDLRRNVCDPALFIRPDGSRLTFRSGISYSTPGATSSSGTATLTTNADGSYTLRDEDSRVLTFGSQGELLSIKDSLGIGWTLTRPDSSTVVVTHTNGQSFRLVVINGSTAYGAAKQIQVTDPDGNVYLYDATTSGYDDLATPVSHLGAINKVTLPGTPSTVISYVYYPDEIAPAGSTGSKFMQLKEVDYNGVAHDTTTYDSVGRATVSSLVDGKERTSIIYGSNATGPTATVTDPLNHTSLYQYDGAGNLVSVHGDAAGQGCPATDASMSYDANGFMTSSTDNRATVTKYTYNSGGLLQQKIEAAGTSIQRTIDYVWDTTTSVDRLSSVTVEGWSKTAYAYNAQNRVASIKVTNLSGTGIANQTLTTSYGYTLYANGMVHTIAVTHPSPNNSDIDTFTYDALGNLASYVDGLGHTTTYSNYNGLGEVGRIVGPNGDITDYGYDPRGRIHTKTMYPNGTAATWTYAYDGFGLLYTESAPDGRVTTWNRDADMRVTSIVRNDKDGTSTEAFGYDDNGDITSHTVSRGGATSLSETLRYDGLGRLYQRQGMHGQLLTYSYDGNGNVLSLTDAAGHVVNNQYDALNRLTRVASSGGASPPLPSSAPALSAPANSSSGTYSLTWSSVSNATSYKLQQQVNGGGWSTVQTNSSTSYSVSSQSPGTYRYQVIACNVSGCGPWSSTSTVYVTQIIGNIDSVHIDSGSGEASVLGWACSTGLAQSISVDLYVGGPAGSGTGIGRYTANQASEPAVASSCGVSSGSYRFSIPLSTATRSQYAGQAIYIHGISPVGASNLLISGSGNDPVPVNEPAGAPTLSAPSSNNSGSYTVSWSAVTGSTSYTLQQRVNGGSWSTVQSNGNTSWAASGEGNGTYGYQVQACNSSGCGPWCVVANVTVLLPPPTPASITVPASSSGSVAVSWAASSTATSYTLQHRLGTNAWSNAYSGSATGVTVAEGSTGSYTYQVEACNSGGCSGWKGSSAVAVTIPPASAPSLSVPSSNTSGTYTVSWTGVSGATSYTLQEQVNGGGWATMQSSSATSRAISGKGTGNYGYRVEACNAGGCGSFSSTSTVAVTLIPASPSGLSATVYDTYEPDLRPPHTYELDASWSASSGATSYDFQYCVTGSTCTVANTTSTAVYIPVHSTSFTTNVRACNASGCSAWSSTVTPPVVQQ